MFKYLLLFSSLCFSGIRVFGQTGCYTDTTHSVKISYGQLQSYQKLAHKRTEADTIYLPLQIHVIRNKAGLQSDETSITEGIRILNQRFRTTRIQFTVCRTFNYITSDLYASLDGPQESTDLINLYNNPLTIDVFYVNDLTYLNACGFATIGWSGDGYIVMKKGCENNATLEHEMGHYFNLLHTHETAYGAELVNGSNCTTAGDQLCDTPADPNLQWEVLPYNCAYSSTTLKDANGALYKPLTTNIMSYAAANCKFNFTPEQITRMRYYYDHVIANTYSCSDKPDFTVSLAINPTEFKKGQPNEVRMIVQNTSGIVYNGSVGYRIYLMDADSKKTELKTGNFNRTYTSMMRDTVALLLDVPGNLADNTYTLTTWIDSESAIDENNESNNYHSQQVGLYPTGGLLPDLTVSYTGSTSHYTGETLPVQVQYTNSGNTTAAAYFTNDLFVSEDDQLSTDDVNLGYKYTPLSLAPGQSHIQEFKVGVPVTKPGYLIACADALNVVEELNDNNNCVVTKILNVTPPANLPKPDFAITGHRFTTIVNNQFSQLETVQMELTIVNNGAPTDDSHLLTGLYFSRDNNLSADDILMNYAVGGGVKQTQFTIPLNPPRGGYYIIAKADFKNYLTETNENNNTYNFKIELALTVSADLQLNSATLSNYNWSDNQVITLNAGLSNIGTYESPYRRMNVFLRKDSLRFKFPVLSSLSPLFFSPWDSTVLAIGQKKNTTFTFHTGKLLSPGKYFVMACASQPDGYRESETDNCLVFDKPVIVKSAVLTGFEEERNAASHQLYPNPAQQEVVILGEEMKEVSIISMQGITHIRKVNGTTFDVTGIAPGLYTVRLSGAAGTTFHKLMIH